MVSAWRHDEDQAGRALQGGHDDVSLVDEAALLVEPPPEPLTGDLGARPRTRWPARDPWPSRS